MKHLFKPYRLTRGIAALAATLVFCVVSIAPAQAFVHPGGLHTQADFSRMAAKVAANESPWVDSYNQLTAVSEANLGWPWHPQTQIWRGAGPQNYARSQLDALAIYYLALRYQITGNTNYANYAIQGMDAWSGMMTNGVGGNSNWALGAGICGYEAGEALRGYTNWLQTSISNYRNFLKLFASGNDNFLIEHNNTCDSHYWCNWDAAEAEALYERLEREVIPEFYTRNEKGIPTAWIARMRESMARLTPRFSANRAVCEYTEQHYLPAAIACQSRVANKGAVGKQMVDWRHAVEQEWAALRFGAIKVETRDGKHIIEVQVGLHGLDPKAVRVELYADGIKDSPPVRQEMTCLHPLADESGGYAYSATVPANRPPTDYTARVMPCCDGVAIPLEDQRILWQR